MVVQKTAKYLDHIHRAKLAENGTTYYSDDGNIYLGVDNRLKLIGKQPAEVIQGRQGTTLESIGDLDRATIIERLEAVPEKADKCYALAMSIVL